MTTTDITIADAFTLATPPTRAGFRQTQREHDNALALFYVRVRAAYAAWWQGMAEAGETSPYLAKVLADTAVQLHVTVETPSFYRISGEVADDVLREACDLDDVYHAVDVDIMRALLIRVLSAEDLLVRKGA